MTPEQEERLRSLEAAMERLWDTQTELRENAAILMRQRDAALARVKELEDWIVGLYQQAGLYKPERFVASPATYRDHPKGAGLAAKLRAAAARLTGKEPHP